MKKLIILVTTLVLFASCKDSGKGQMYNEIRIQAVDKNVDYKANSSHTNWNAYKAGDQSCIPPDNIASTMQEGEYCIWDHSATAVGYYGSKADYQHIESVLSKDVKESHYGHDGNCIVVFKKDSIKQIDVIEKKEMPVDGGIEKN